MGIFFDNYEAPKEHEWRCLYCGKRFVSKSINEIMPANVNTRCRSNPNGGNHMPVKVK